MGDIFMEIVQEKFDRKLKEAVDKEVKKVVEKAVDEAVQKEREDVREQVTEQVTKDVTIKVAEKTRIMERLSLIQKKYIKNKPLPVIADELETDLEELRPLYNLVSKNPGKTVEELYNLAAG